MSFLLPTYVSILKKEWCALKNVNGAILLSSSWPSMNCFWREILLDVYLSNVAGQRKNSFPKYQPWLTLAHQCVGGRKWTCKDWLHLIDAVEFKFHAPYLFFMPWNMCFLDIVFGLVQGFNIFSFLSSFYSTMNVHFFLWINIIAENVLISFSLSLSLSHTHTH